MTAPHSSLGASSMYRWSACPGSVRESANAESKSSSYAEEGTDAHALAAFCLNRGHNPGSYIGKTLKVDGRKVAVDRDMALAVQVFIDAVIETLDEEAGDKLHIEHRFDLSKVYPGCFGTADAVVWKPSKSTLHVFDYKHGAGIPVNVKGNPQLRYYGLGALVDLEYPADQIVLTIVQPRCDHADGPIRSETLDALDLLDFRTDLVDYAKATEDPNAPLVPGSHCRFCPAAKSCPKLRETTQALAKTEFKAALPYDPAQLKTALDSREIVKAWLKALDEFAYAEAEAGRLPASVGYKLVEKRASRKWGNEGAAVDYLQLNYRDVVLREAFEPRALKSPAQLEKVDGVKKGDFDQFMVKESSGRVLVPVSDKRPEWKPTTAQDEFTAVETDDLDIPKFLKR